MKKTLSRLFFASDCSRGALFALTLLVIGNYLWFSLAHLLVLVTGKIHDRIIVTYGIGALLITLYSLILAVTALIGLIRVLRRGRRFRALWHLLPAGLCLAAGAVGFVRVFPPVYWLEYRITAANKQYVDLTSGFCCGFPGLAPEYWGVVFLLSLLLLLAGGMLLTAVFTGAEGRKFRSAFGAATLALWGILALGYVATLVMAQRESREAAAIRSAVEHRFGHPLTAAGLEAVYRSGGRIDPDFWPRLEKLRREPSESEGKKAWDIADIVLPDRPSAETLAWYDRLLRNHRDAVDAWERGFESPPPLDEKRFVSGGLVGMVLGELNTCRTFARLERSRLIRALAGRDGAAALAGYRLMGNAARGAREVPALVGGLVWIAIEHVRMDCAEALLESRLLTSDQLDLLDADLAELEREVSRIQNFGMYCEAVMQMDLLAAMAEGRCYSDLLLPEFRGGVRPGAFSSYGRIFPLWWFNCARDMKVLLSSFLKPDFTHIEIPRDQFLVMCNMLLPALQYVGERFDALTARGRGMRTLIRAEQHRRRYGEFPKTLSPLPVDPFTGKQLIYEVGPAKISETIWKKPTDPMSRSEVVRSVEAVSVRTPADLSRRSRRPESGVDATRALIRR